MNNIEKVSIIDQVLEKVKTLINNGESGVLFGWTNKKHVFVTGCLTATVSRDVLLLNSFVPGGLGLCGTFNSSENTVLEHDDCIIHIWLAPDGLFPCIANSTKIIKMKSLTWNQVLDILAENLVLFQIRGLINVKLNVVKDRFEFGHDQIITPETIFKLADDDIMLTVHTSQNKTVKDIAPPLKKLAGPRLFEKIFRLLQVNILTCISSGRANVPYVKHDPFQKGVRRLPVFVNALCFASVDTSLLELPALFRDALSRQFYLLKKVMTVRREYDVTSFNLPLPGYHHFAVPGCPHPMSVCYPANQDDDELHDYRKDFLHATFSLPTSGPPVFRRPQEIYLYPPVSTDLALLNPHTAVRNPTLKHVEIAMVHGMYSYYHYNQKGFNDNGWGCAYRSLQTLISWFKLQGFTSLPIPTHQQIQEIVVAVGDRGEGLIGSRDWLGAIEVSHVLNAYLKLEVKILNVQKGSELNSVGRQLLAHFESQGTPIMIGGGAFAHTILGVCFSPVTGDTLFLILDPHYIGPDDGEKIVSRGWCGWKNIKFWSPNAFYNLCLPLRPEGC